MAPTNTPTIEFIQTLIRLETAGVPLEDLSNTLLELSLVDQFTGMEIQKVFDESFQSIGGLHGVDHTVRVVFWVLYLVEISNRLGYPVNEEEALAAVFAALVHDLSRTDDMPGGEHGKLASEQFRQFIQEQLSPEMMERCLIAIQWHGYPEDPQDYDPVWMLLKDADALDRARLAHPGIYEGCDPSRLRLPVLKENTLILDACLTISILLPILIVLTRPEKMVFRVLTDAFIRRLITDSRNADEVIQQAVRLVVDRYYSQR
jgi:hypothetical protein